MDLPIGMPLKEGMETDGVDFRKLFHTFREHRLTGYIALDIMTNNGIEEGLLLLNGGEPVAAEYGFVASGRTVKGDGALPLFMNGCLGEGRFDICEMTADEFLGAREKNRDAVLRAKPTENELLALLPDTFTEKTLEGAAAQLIRGEAIKKAGGVSRDEVLKKYGIKHPDKKAVDTLLKGVIDGSV